MKQFLSAQQLEYSTVDVVQLRLMQYHSLTSFQHMTISCTSHYASVFGTANSVKDLIHLVGDSGNKIGSHLTTVDSGTGEVRLSKLCYNVVLKAWCLISDLVWTQCTLPIHACCEYFPDCGVCEISRGCWAIFTGKRPASCQRLWSGHNITICPRLRVYRRYRTPLLLVTHLVCLYMHACVCVCECLCYAVKWFGLLCFVV